MCVLHDSSYLYIYWQIKKNPRETCSCESTTLEYVSSYLYTPLILVYVSSYTILLLLRVYDTLILYDILTYTYYHIVNTRTCVRILVPFRVYDNPNLRHTVIPVITYDIQHTTYVSSYYYMLLFVSSYSGTDVIKDLVSTNDLLRIYQDS
jgi:hypothetical protein